MKKAKIKTGAVVEWLECRKPPQGREFEAGLCNATTGKLSLLIQQ